MQCTNRRSAEHQEHTAASKKLVYHGICNGCLGNKTDSSFAKLEHVDLVWYMLQLIVTAGEGPPRSGFEIPAKNTRGMDRLKVAQNISFTKTSNQCSAYNSYSFGTL